MPFITSTADTYLINPPGTPEEQLAAIHDSFSVEFAGAGSGEFKIHGEVYELTLADCLRNRAWLNQFAPNARGDGHHTAGVLPAKFGNDLTLPRDAPTLLRYEAGTYSQNPRSAQNRRFPGKATQVRFPPGDTAQEVNTLI